ncbi:MAG TPA: SDR family oxidoreductase [Armatimonadota bacterium]|jgi:NAD(P)-dependent dehydrogenase (short-subunit alcohol dehydrogenase family)
MDLFSLRGRTALVLGGSGVLGQGFCRGFADAGANVAVAGRNMERAQAAADAIAAAGGCARAYRADAGSLDDLHALRDAVASDFGPVDVLLNAVGGNRPDATALNVEAFFDLPAEALESVVSLNLMGGAILPAQVFGKAMAASANGGSIIHIVSASSYLPLSRVVGYSAAKAAVLNFTRWLAVEMAKSGANVRVNAIAPGFFLTEQNRFLLTDEATGNLTARGRTILDHTPMGRFGTPDDLMGAAVFLASNASQFVTGAVIPVDGGFTAFSGV